MTQICFASPFISGFPPHAILNQGFTDEHNTADFAAWYPVLEDQGHTKVNDDDYAKTDPDLATCILVTRVGGPLGDPLNPLTTDNCILYLRTRKSVATDPHDYNITKELRQNYVDESNQGTLIASIAVTPITDTFTLYSHTLSAGEVNSITDWPNLFFRYVVDRV